MERLENIPFEGGKNLIRENKEDGKRKEEIIKEILNMKRKAEKEPDAINIHLRKVARLGSDEIELKNIEENLLRAYLEEEDYDAFDNAQNGAWDENNGDFKKYMGKILKWEKKEKEDSGADPKLFARRDFATMIRSIILTKGAEQKSRERELKNNF